jgi:MFS family permease
VLLVLWLERHVRHERPLVRSWHLQEVAAGLRFSWRHPSIRTCLALAVFAGIIFNLAIPMPLLARRYFHLGGGGYGLMLAVFGVGALPGAVLAGAQANLPNAREVLKLAVATGVAVIICSYCPTFPTMLVCLCLVGTLSIWFIARANAYVLLEAPPDLRGRVASVWTLAVPGSYVFTSFITGWISDSINPRLAYSVAGIGLITIAAARWRSMPRRARIAR